MYWNPRQRNRILNSLYTVITVQFSFSGPKVQLLQLGVFFFLVQMSRKCVVQLFVLGNVYHHNLTLLQVLRAEIEYTGMVVSMCTVLYVYRVVRKTFDMVMKAISSFGII